MTTWFVETTAAAALLALNGFSPEVTGSRWDRGRTVLLMDGGDLMAVLEGRIDLARLLLRKKEHAARTGDVFLPVARILDRALGPATGRHG